MANRLSAAAGVCFTLSKRRKPFEDFLWIEAPQLLGSNTVPQDAGKPEGDADFDGAKYYVMGIATC